MNSRIHSILSPAYEPCPQYNDCKKEGIRWDPPSGHVPRGFCGAIGRLEEVKLILVVAEPGDPLDKETHTGIESALKKAYECLKNKTTQFHRNIRGIIDLCWPNEAFETQMRRVWLTESVLCSAKKETGPVKASVARACIHRYLAQQLELFPGALVVALGLKARDRLRSSGIVDFFHARAAAPPGCNLPPPAKDSWQKIAEKLRSQA